MAAAPLPLHVKRNADGSTTIEKRIRASLVGAYGVGKTSLWDAVKGKAWGGEPSLQFGIEITQLIGPHPVDTHQVQLFDAGGGHRMLDLAYRQFFAYHVTVLCYSIDNPDSFSELRLIYETNKEYLKSFGRLVLVGLKSDLERYRAVSAEDVTAFASLIAAPSFEMSTRDGTGFEEFKDLLFFLADEIIPDPPKPAAIERKSSCTIQ